MYIVVIESFIVWVLQVYGSKYTFVWHPGIVIFLCIAWIKKKYIQTFSKKLKFLSFDILILNSTLFEIAMLWGSLFFIEKKLKVLTPWLSVQGVPPKRGIGL